jgi:hypothetical protein
VDRVGKSKPGKIKTQKFGVVVKTAGALPQFRWLNNNTKSAPPIYERQGNNNKEVSLEILMAKGYLGNLGLGGKK